MRQKWRLTEQKSGTTEQISPFYSINFTLWQLLKELLEYFDFNVNLLYNMSMKAISIGKEAKYHVYP
jgi:hypothetical protein